MEKVKSVAVTPLEDLILFVAFNTDERRMFDVNPYFTGSWYGKLAGEVFGNPGELEKLTGLLYPEFERRLDEAVAACRRDGADGVFEIPLLFENGYGKRFDAVLAVWSSPEIRRERLKRKRGLSDEEIAERERKQLPAHEKLERADFAVVNNGPRELLRKQIRRLSEKLK